MTNILLFIHYTTACYEVFIKIWHQLCERVRTHLMPLNNAQFRRYDYNVLRLPKEDRTTYHEQVDRLILNLKVGVHKQTRIRITNVVKAGSFAKFTILRKTAEDPVDVDVVFYISGKSVTDENYASLSQQIYDILVELYPTKSVEDFKLQRKAATVEFVGTGLKVDIVPVIENERRPGFGYQFDVDGNPPVQTCAPCQIKFVKDRKDRDSDFRTLVRLAKKWRNRAELTALKSFTIELIMAHLLDKSGATGSIEERFREFLLYIAQSGLKEQISFPENGPITTTFTDPVVIIDPVCDTNNVASRITEDERQEIVEAATKAWETANFASAENDNSVWKEIFGPKFNTEEA